MCGANLTADAFARHWSVAGESQEIHAFGLVSDTFRESLRMTGTCDVPCNSSTLKRRHRASEGCCVRRD